MPLSSMLLLKLISCLVDTVGRLSGALILGGHKPAALYLKKQRDSSSKEVYECLPVFDILDVSV